MVTNLILKSDQYYCGNCMMRQPRILPRCHFCGYIFSNLEEIMIKENTAPIVISCDNDEWIDEDEELTETQKAMLKRLSKSVQELCDSIFDGDDEE